MKKETAAVLAGVFGLLTVLGIIRLRRILREKNGFSNLYEKYEMEDQDAVEFLALL
ncbi:MAG: hypothetical protein LBE36_08310 [Flavobacteriaceae bacterium]|jgi:hypothetical protein|nr:hypothetical protein [Flavobacteriaceae bacterium]